MYEVLYPHFSRTEETISMSLPSPLSDECPGIIGAKIARLDACEDDIKDKIAAESRDLLIEGNKLNIMTNFGLCQVKIRVN